MVAAIDLDQFGYTMATIARLVDLCRALIAWYPEPGFGH